MWLKENFNDWFWLLISILTVWRLTSMLCYEAGPFDLLSKIRKIFYKVGLGKLIDCFHCTSVWISLICTIAVYKPHAESLFLFLAIAAGASIIEKITFYIYNSKDETNDEDS